MQPTSDSLHLGNYLGALVNWVELQESSEAFYFIADLHALTVPTDPEVVRRRTRVTAAQFIAGGVDPARSAVFCQSHLPQHAELGWVMNCITAFGEASRMTQFKDKVAKGQNANVGLFTYPMLMAADILMYDADKVPVGDVSVAVTHLDVYKGQTSCCSTWPSPRASTRRGVGRPPSTARRAGIPSSASSSR